MPALPYLTDALPGTGGRIKERPDDFRVEELPLERPAGRGRHVWFRVRKRGLSTPAAAERIARFLRVPVEEIGYAGLKDTQAVTEQTMSLYDADTRRLGRFRDPAVRVDRFALHGRRLQLGQMGGNRFTIRIRGLADLPAAEAAARAVLAVLERRGVPHYFGEQRFGARGDNAELGALLSRGDLRTFTSLYLGHPRPEDEPRAGLARRAFDAGRLDKAMRLWPAAYRVQRQALGAYLRRRDPRDVVESLGRWTRRLLVESFQSEVFNAVLAARIDAIDRALPGDLLADASGRTVPVEDPSPVAERVARFELSPTGPLVAPGVLLAQRQAGRVEQDVLARLGVRPDALTSAATYGAHPGRRPLRFRPTDPILRAARDRHGPSLEVAFTAPPGAYATVLLREILKQG